MTVNQAIDKLTANGKKLNEQQKKLSLSLLKVKMEFGGRTKIENVDKVNEIIEQNSEEK
jgi:hypothetical protein